MEILYYGQGHRIATIAHSHPYYQLEVCLSGEFHAVVERKNIRLLPGDYILIPPAAEHCFVSRKKEVEYYSIKFDSSREICIIPRHDDVTKYFLEELHRVIAGMHSFSPFSDSGKFVMEALLEAFFRYITQISVLRSADVSRFMVDLKNIICSRGYEMNIGELVKYFKCSRSQFKYRFKQESRWEGTLKEYIEQILWEELKAHLQFSDMTLVQIARNMNFPNASQLSKFIRKKAGMPAKVYRSILKTTHYK